MELKEGTAELENWKTLFENPEDWASVEFGYYLYDTFGEDMTFLEFQFALTADIRESFEKPAEGFVAPGPAVPQENQYAQNQFDYYNP